MRPRECEERFLAAGELVERPSHGESVAHAAIRRQPYARVVEAIERRAAFLLLAVTLGLAFFRADFTTQTGRGWEVTVYIIGLVSLAAAAALLVFAVAARELVDLSRERRERLLFIAFALVAVAVCATVLLRAYSAYYLHRHGFPGV